jgi:UDP-GlcNAc:undecaprenyl-phosphate/decaprenyl-phosphate GlcNAc-1-phosphate transferase
MRLAKAYLLSEKLSHELFMNMLIVALASFLCAGITYFLCINAKQICLKLGLMDVPDERKHHASVTPLMGGVTLQFAVIPLLLLLALTAAPSGWVNKLLIFVAAVAAMTIIGLADDRHTLSARDRLLASFLVFGSAAIIDPLFNVRVLSFAHPAFEIGVGTGWLAVIFTSICGVGLVNAINMADGKNGLVIGLCLGWLALLGARAPEAMLPVLLVISAAWFVLLIFNMRGRLFLGDGGAYGIATAISLVAISTYNVPGAHAGRAISADELMLLFSVPVLDSFRLTFVRLKRGQSPMAADRDHLHHHLQSRFGWPAGLLVYWGISLLPSAVVLLAG